MVLGADKERVKTLLKDTITLLCRNGLTFKSKFSIEALIGVTLDDEDIFLVSINELIRNELGKSSDTSRVTTGGSADESFSSGNESQKKQHRSRKRKRSKKVKVKSEPGASDVSDGEQFAGESDDEPHDPRRHDEPIIKKQAPDDNDMAEGSASHRLHLEQGFDNTADHSNDEDSGDIVFIKQEMDTWSENAPNVSQTNFNFSQGVNSSQGDMNFSSLSDMNLVPVTSQEEGSLVWPPGTSQQRSLQGRSATVTAGVSSGLQLGDGQMMGQQPQQIHKMQFGLQCSMCPQTRHSKAALKIHENWHRGVYAYHCSMCNKGFMSTTALKGHMANHTGQREFECMYCSKSYAYSANLKAHIQTKHPNA